VRSWFDLRSCAASRGDGWRLRMRIRGTAARTASGRGIEVKPTGNRKHLNTAMEIVPTVVASRRGVRLPSENIAT
jgi:hypothetical protein